MGSASFLFFTSKFSLTMSTDQSSSSSSGGSWSEAVGSIFSYNGNVMLAAIISLLLVILFVLLLHLYAKWFLAHARRRRQRSSLSVLHHFHNFSLEFESSYSPATKGLDASVIASIPLFVCDRIEMDPGCVICLGGLEDGDVGRRLGKCGHAFHVECIDMWLQSHCTCPICRSPAATDEGSVEIVIGNVTDEAEESQLDASGSQLPYVKRMMRCNSGSERKVHPSAV